MTSKPSSGHTVNACHVSGMCRVGCNSGVSGMRRAGDAWRAGCVCRACHKGGSGRTVGMGGVRCAGCKSEVCGVCGMGGVWQWGCKSGIGRVGGVWRAGCKSGVCGMGGVWRAGGLWPKVR